MRHSRRSSAVQRGGVIDLDAVPIDEWELRIRGETYVLPIAVPTPLWRRLLAIRHGLREVDREGDPDAVYALLGDAHDIVMELVRMRSPDAPDLLLTTEQLCEVLSRVFRR